MRAAALFCLAFFSTAVPAAAFPARIVSCPDGDTCRLETEQEVVKIRPAEIVASEINQPYGVDACDVLCRIVCGRNVENEPRGTSYDGVVGLIRVQSADTSEAMVSAGAAWDYAQYDPGPMVPVLKAKARAGRLGLWAAAHPVAPWNWRHRGAGRFR